MKSQSAQSTRSSSMNASRDDLLTVGRSIEAGRVRACLKAKRNVLLEGPVGVGKTHLALSITQTLGIPIFRVDGDSRYSEQKLSGWFDPPTVIKKGFCLDSFIPGPLVEAMQQGGVLFINELNRLPEGVQNVLLPAIDERMLVVPRLGMIRAKPDFLVIATQNPKEFVATSHLSEAILDRFELVVLDYQSEEEEKEIVSARLKQLLDEVSQSRSHQKKETSGSSKMFDVLPIASVKLARITRNHPKVRRGASIRAAMSLTEIAAVMIQDGMEFSEAFLNAALIAFPTRIEVERDTDSEQSHRMEVEELLKEWVEAVLEDLDSSAGSSQQAGIKKKP